MEYIFLLIESEQVIWVASSVLMYELGRNADAQRRDDALGMLKFAAEVWAPDETAKQRAKYLASLGYNAMDALHLCCAEGSKADFLITTDDRFLRRIGRGVGKPMTVGANPLDWVQRRKP